MMGLGLGTLQSMRAPLANALNRHKSMVLSQEKKSCKQALDEFKRHPSAKALEGVLQACSKQTPQKQFIG